MNLESLENQDDERPLLAEGGSSAQYDGGDDKDKVDPRYDTETDCCCYSCCECCGCRELKAESKGNTFCCCCPLKVGIWLIDFTLIYFTLYYTIKAIFLFWNEYYDGYYPLVLLVCLAPIWFSFGLFYIYTSSATKEGRNKLFLGVILAIVSVILYYTWSLIYVYSIYE